MEFVWSFFHEREYAIMNSMKDTRTSNRYAVVDLEATGTGTDAKSFKSGLFSLKMEKSLTVMQRISIPMSYWMTISRI